MSAAQRSIEHLLLLTGASRALLQLRRDAGDFAIAAEAVQHGQRQLRHVPYASDTVLLDVSSIDDGWAEIRQDTPPIGLEPEPVTRWLRAPLLRERKLIGVVSLHRYGAHARWSVETMDAVERARTTILDFAENGSPDAEVLRSTAIRGVLDELRTALGVQRCTFRQPVEDAYAFPVTFESRDPDQRSLLGDFTIIQTGQPVIVKLLAERTQVIQNDCRVASPDPLFHRMLDHYGGMRAQMVTPIIVGDQLKGVLSVHELRAVRAWTASEKVLAAKAAAFIGALTEEQ
jgi:GAF domain-containing protein